MEHWEGLGISNLWKKAKSLHLKVRVYQFLQAQKTFGFMKSLYCISVFVHIKKVLIYRTYKTIL